MIEERARIGVLAWCAILPLGLVGWWALVLGVDGAAWWFSPASMGWTPLLAFGLADATVVGIPSLVAARFVSRGDLDGARSWLWAVAGGQGYATMWSVLATVLTGEAPYGPLLMLPIWGVCLTAAWVTRPVDAWFLTSEDRPASAHAAWTIAHAVLFDGLFLVLLPWLFLLVERHLGLPPMHDVDLFWPLVAVVVVLNLGIGLGSGIVMALYGRGTPLPVDTAAELVVAGPYARVRNPMAAVGILQGVLLGAALASWLVVLYALVGAALWHGFVRPIEEADLAARFGEPYRQYKANVPLWVPRLTAWRP